MNSHLTQQRSLKNLVTCVYCLGGGITRAAACVNAAAGHQRAKRARSAELNWELVGSVVKKDKCKQAWPLLIPPRILVRGPTENFLLRKSPGAQFVRRRSCRPQPSRPRVSDSQQLREKSASVSTIPACVRKRDAKVPLCDIIMVHRV